MKSGRSDETEAGQPSDKEMKVQVLFSPNGTSLSPNPYALLHNVTWTVFPLRHGV